MQTYHIHITGIVQGVGFRPFVYKIANGLDLKGSIKNGLDGVHFLFNGDEELANQVYQSIVENAPSNSKIHSHSLSQIGITIFSKLEILRSDDTTGEPNLPLTPDFALCPTCSKELSSPANRRFNYPFTTCTYCGPRYSITNKLPYDRHTTTMDTFDMCPDCKKEYNNPLDRRYYSQTNSCDTCGIKLSFIDSNSPIMGEKPQTNKQLIDEAVNQLQQQKIIAIKGIGGYLFLCDAQSKEAIQTLRKRKHRPTKPFAVMYPSIESLSSEFKINAEEKEALTNEVSSIVLLQKKEDVKPSLLAEYIAPGLNRIGCLIPYAPLFQLILDRILKPVIATSANISGSPIIYNDKIAMNELASIADFILIHNREILIPQDDSVISFTAKNNHRIIHRRSRGLAPSYENPSFSSTSKTILATGAQMKSSFSLLSKNQIYISQYLGDMDSYDTQNEYVHTLTHLQKLLACQPEVILTDKHPNYFTTEWAKEKADQRGIPTHQVQHHKAHFMAVLAENKLENSKEPILGVIWDGTGLGDDEQIWGGEFFVYENKEISRSSHIGYFAFMLGDKMPKEPRISAFCITHSINGSDEHIKTKFTDQEWELYHKILANPDTRLATSSMGRLFDAAACLLLNIDKTSYEGEAAIQLENLAKSHRMGENYGLADSYFNHLKRLPSNRSVFLIESILSDLKKGKSPNKIAYYFHVSLVDLVRRVAKEKSIKNIAFSGGVFQNELLTDLIISLLQNEFDLFFHKRLSPNDENISFGQLAAYMILNETEN